MKGFLVLGYNDNVSDSINLLALEEELLSKNEIFKKGFPHSECYDKVVGYQIFKTNDCVFKQEEKFYLSGDMYGDFFGENLKKLNYESSIDFLLQKKSMETEHQFIEGNAVFCGVFEKSMIFQNDLEGYRKLFYFKNKHLIGITNNLPLLLKAIRRNWKIRKNAVLSYLIQRESKWPLTFIEEILVLPPLSRATLRKGHLSIESITYSQLYDPKKIDEISVKENLFEQYKTNVARKKTDRTAVTLSGGYDSNCLVKLFKTQYNDNFTAVSVGFDSVRERDSNVYDETIYAQKIANKLKIPFIKYIIDKDQFFSKLDDFVDSIDQPGHDPSSNFMMNAFLKEDGYDTVVNGMGGDACFSKKKNLKRAIDGFNLSKKTGSYFLLSALANIFSFRGPFYFFNTKGFIINPGDFISLYELSKINRSPVSKYIETSALKSLYAERELRSDYYEGLFTSSKSELDIFYALSIFSNPDEYHAALMSERNGMEILMPFVDVKAVTSLMGASLFHDVSNRKFESSIFGGIDEDLLLKSKSGFSIPYSEWIKPSAEEVLSFFLQLKYFSPEDFDFESFAERYNRDKAFSSTVFPNQVIWKLMIVRDYALKHSIIF